MKSMISFNMTLLLFYWFHKIKILPWVKVETENNNFFAVLQILHGNQGNPCGNQCDQCDQCSKAINVAYVCLMHRTALSDPESL